jgi:hypothetical protein
MKCIIGNQVVLSRPPEGPLAAQIGSFAKSVSEQGYSLPSIHRRVLLAACFSRWLKQKGAHAWAQQPVNVQPAHWAQRLTFVRGFARHHSATDPRTQIPPLGLLPFRPKRARPYLYSDDEIRSLLRTALDMPCRYEFGRLRPWTYSFTSLAFPTRNFRRHFAESPIRSPVGWQRCTLRFF